VIKVKSKIDEPIEQLIKRFKRTCEKEGLIRTIKQLGVYEKPSEIKRRRKKVAAYRRRMATNGLL